MVNQIKLFYQYIFSKQMMFVFILINLGEFFGIVYASGVLDGYRFLDMNRYELMTVYIADFITLGKVVTVCLSVFFVSLFFRESAKNLGKYIVDTPVKKFSLFVSKLMCEWLIAMITVTLIFGYFYIIYYFFTPFYLRKNYFISLYLGVLQQNITYVSITFFIMSVFPSMLMMVTPMAMYWYMEMNQGMMDVPESSFILKLYDYIPNLVVDSTTYELVGSWINYVFFNLVLTLFTIFLNINKDIN